MANFYAKYPAGSPSSISVATVQGEGTAGSPVGGILTIQGDPAGTPIPISGSITATNDSIGTTGAAVPAKATYVGANNGGNLIGAIGDSSGRLIQVGAGVAGTPAGGVASVQGVAGGTAMPASQSGTWTVQPGNTANTTPWLATISQGGNSATVSAGGALKVDNTGSTQPVSGTVTADQGGAPWTVTGTGTAGTAAAGVLTVQGIASMTPLLVNGSGSTQPVSGTVAVTQSTSPWVTDQTTAAATFQDGAIAFGSLTTSFATVVTTGGVARVVQMRNNTNAVVLVSLDAGSTTSYTLDSGDQASVDLKMNGRSIAASTALQAKYSGAAPTSGSVRVNVMY